MPLEHIGKQRESLTVTSEEYKKQFLRYLQAREYYNIKTSSDVEGTFADVILTRKGEAREYWLEIKATEVSLNDKEFLNQLAKYLAFYLSITKEKRFKLILACYKLINRDYFKSVFEYLETEGIQELLKDILKNADLRERKVIEGKPQEDIKAFFEDTTIKEADLKALEFAEAKLTPKAPQKPTIAEAEYAQTIMTNLGDISPVMEREKLFLNLFSINFPAKLFASRSVYSTAKELYADKHVLFPPHEFRDGQIYTFQEFDKENSLSPAVIPTTVRTIDTAQFATNEPNLEILRTIVNRWIRRVCEEKNMHYDKRTSTFYYRRELSSPGIVTAKWKPRVRDSTRELTRPMKSRDGKINYWVHRGAEISGTIFARQVYVQIRPRFLFSWDGLTLMEGVESDLRDRKFRKSKYNRNLNQLYDVRFWCRHIFPESENPGVESIAAYFDPKYSQFLKVLEQASLESVCKSNEDKVFDVEALDSIESEQLSEYIEEE